MYTWFYDIELIESTYEGGLYYTVSNDSLQQNTYMCSNEIVSINTITQTIENYSRLGAKRIFIQDIYNKNDITYVSWFKTDTVLPKMENVYR